MIALLFPGQGTQKAGLFSVFVNAFSCAKNTLDEIEDAISLKISELVENASLEELSRTDNAQLVVFTSSMICLSVLQQEYGFDIESQCKYLAGHSLGEYSALCASGVLTLRGAAQLVKKRGEIMLSVCSSADEYQMTAILGTSISDIENCLDSNSDCVIANDNSNTQVVLSGRKVAVDGAITKILEHYPMVRTINLNTSGPFHSPLMGKASIKLDEYLSASLHNVRNPSVPVISNVTAEPITDKRHVYNELISQMISRVRWRETVRNIIADNEVNKIVELSPGHVLTGMIKRDYPEMELHSLETVSQIESFMKG